MKKIFYISLLCLLLQPFNLYAGFVSDESLSYQEWKFDNQLEEVNNLIYKSGWNISSNKYAGNGYNHFYRAISYDLINRNLLGGLDYKTGTASVYRCCIRQSGRKFNITSPVLELDGQNTKKYYTSMVFEAPNGANISNISSYISRPGIDLNPLVSEIEITQISENKHQVTFATHANNNLTLIDGSKVRIELETDISTYDISIDDVTLSLDKPVHNVPENLYAVKIGSDTYYTNIEEKFDGVYNESGDKINTTVEVAAKMLQAHQTLTEFQRFDAKELKRNLELAYDAKLIADDIEAQRQLTVSAASAITKSPFSPAYVTASMIADIAAVAQHYTIEHQTNMVLSIALESAIKNVESSIEAKERYFGDVKRVIEYDDLQEYAAYKANISGYSKAVVDIIESSFHASTSFDENMKKTIGDFVFSYIGVGVTAPIMTVNGYNSAQELADIINRMQSVTDNASRSPMDDSKLALFKGIVEDNNYHKTDDSTGLSENPISNELNFTWQDIYGSSPSYDNLEFYTFFSSKERHEGISFQGPGVGELVGNPTNNESDVIKLTTGSPIEMTLENVNLPDDDFLFNFDILWGTNTGYLEIFFGDLLIDTVYAPEDLSYDFDSLFYNISRDDFWGINTLDVRFLFDGVTGSNIYLNNINIAYNNYPSSTIDVPEPKTYFILLFGLILFFLYKRKTLNKE